MDAGIKLWAEKGLKNISDLYTEEVLLSFEEISHPYSIPKKHFFKHLQLRSFISSMQKHFMTIVINEVQKYHL